MKRCKRDGASMNNQGVVNEDRISELPEALILLILSLLPTKVAISTSVLSKQWQSHWKMLPILKFVSNSPHILELGNVRRSLLSHKAPVLQSFHLKVYLGKKNNAVDTGILIGIALTRNVRELVLDVFFHKGSFTFPASLYNCETLQTLKLSMCVIMDVPSAVCLKSLRTLHLNGVDFKDDESFLNLLSGCPNLEKLDVHTILSSNVETFTIAVPSLQRLSIHNVYGTQRHSGYVINAPSLKYLKIEGFKALDESCLIENVPELVEAKIINVSKIIDEKLLGPLTSVKRLSLTLSPLKIKFHTGCIFNQLVYLELYTDKELWWNLLTLMLGSSPKLQVLKLINKSWFDLVASGKWKQPKNVPECLLLHLETFIWKGYKWKQKEQRKVAKYILRNSNHLKRATFFSKYISSKNRLVVIEELKSLVKDDTNSCQFQFNWNL